MSKRASPDEEAEHEHSDDGSASNSQDGFEEGVPQKKRKLVEFEPVRLLSVSGVNDIDRKVERVQLYKLSERLRGKERLLNEERRKNEALHLRQDRDDNILCTINRYWNRLDEEMRLILNRTVGTSEVKKEVDDEDMKIKAELSTREFLSELAEKEGEDGDALCDKRVHSSLLLVDQLMDSRNRLCEKQKELARILENALNSSTSTDEEKKAALCNVVEWIQKAGEFTRLSSDNERLTQQTDKLHFQNREVILKVAKLEDTVSLQETKIEELHHALEDKDFELKKAWLREERLDYRLYKLAKEQQENVTNGDRKVNGSSKNVDNIPVNVSSRELSELQAEAEQQRELATTRLEEIKEITARNEDLAAECEKLRMEQRTIPKSVIEESEEFKTLKMLYALLYEQFNESTKELEMARSSVNILEAKHSEIVRDFTKENLATEQRLRQQIITMEAEHASLKSTHEMLRLEFEQVLQAQNQQNPKQNDLKTILKSLQTQNHSIRGESAKYKKKWKEAVNNLQHAQRELEKEKRRRERCIMIRVEEDNDELASPDHLSTRDSIEEADLPENMPTPSTIGSDGETFVSRLRSRIDQLKGKLHAFNNVDTERRELLEIVSSERRLQLENTRLISTVKILGSGDRTEKTKFYAEEAARKIRELEDTTRQLRTAAENAKAEQETLMNEMDSTGNAFEELQEQNGKLLAQLKEKDEQHFKVMSDRIMSGQIEAKLRLEKDSLAEGLNNLQNHVDAQAQEIAQYKEAQIKSAELAALKNQEYGAVNQQLISYQRNSVEQQRLGLDLKTRVEKLNAQLKEAQEAVKAKTRSHEQDVYQIRRLEEDKSGLKKRLERAKKTEQLGSSEEVFMEEIKDLKESLTCPSCKVNRKDGVLTKCFHVFCMKCLKTRYDTRRRKCPKCNAAFGANDFHRLYFA